MFGCEFILTATVNIDIAVIFVINIPAVIHCESGGSTCLKELSHDIQHTRLYYYIDETTSACNLCAIWSE